MGHGKLKLSGLLLLAITVAWGQRRNHVPGRLLVGFKPEVSESQASGAVRTLQSRVENRIQGTRVHVVSLPPNVNEIAIANAFRNRPEVEFVEFDELVPPAAITPNDPWYANWEWYLPKISAPTAWSSTTGNSGIVVAIIDTGVFGGHEDLVGKMVQGWNIYNNNSNTSDVYGHGTAVAGTVAAASNNGKGVASVCWNCMLMPLLVSDSTGNASYSNLAAATTWAADHGARVANMSYTVSDSATVTSAAQYFQSKGGVVVAAAGNDGAFDSASDNPYILTVSASDYNDNLYTWSNTGNNIDLAAPGCVYTTANGGGYTSACGTSFSAPVVAGVAGLLFSLNPSFTPQQVVQFLKQNADDLGTPGWDPSYGWGRVNAARAVSAAGGGGGGGSNTGPTLPTVSFQSPQSGAAASGTIPVQVSASSSSGIASVSLYVDNALVGATGTSPYSWQLNTTTLANGSHSLMAVAKDTLGNSASTTESVSVSNTVADTTPPTAAITSPISGATASGNITVSVTAADNVAVTNVRLFVDGAAVASDSSAPYSFGVNTKRWARGAHTLQARASDAAGNVGLSSIVTVYK